MAGKIDDSSRERRKTQYNQATETMLQVFDRARTHWIFSATGIDKMWRTHIHLWQCTVIEDERVLLLPLRWHREET